jgi:hypothetical protein
MKKFKPQFRRNGYGEGDCSMITLNWEEIQKLADRKATLLTKTRVPFQVVAASEQQ